VVPSGSSGTANEYFPYASDEVAGNLNPVGRAYCSFSTLLCVPNALSQSGGYALGAQAGEAAIRQVVTDAGFTRFAARLRPRSTWCTRSVLSLVWLDGGSAQRG
jgi:hypothetical protein